jgi:hypothetical protein
MTQVYVTYDRELVQLLLRSGKMGLDQYLRL